MLEIIKASVEHTTADGCGPLLLLLLLLLLFPPLKKTLQKETFVRMLSESDGPLRHDGHPSFMNLFLDPPSMGCMH